MEVYTQLRQELDSRNTTLVAVSKIQPVEKIKRLYDLGQRDFGENYVQELVAKAALLPGDIRWHFIGHLQSNKVKQVIPLAHLVQGVDSFRLLKEINKQSIKSGLITSCLLQVFIAQEETKFGLDEKELGEIMALQQELTGVRIAGLMGMASFTDDHVRLQSEFRQLQQLFEQYRDRFIYETGPILSMGMSSDYSLAIDNGSNMVRVGSLLFGARPAK
ncbi:MAG: YggS family pyridoxal phosphate-dependent enzyme [Chitinophagaceae bacterium]|nr:MAG: YggS family pyridoxal phosphate-dependent enzyme [Chitinophagaceae bacterium]